MKEYKMLISVIVYDEEQELSKEELDKKINRGLEAGGCEVSLDIAEVIEVSEVAE